MYKSGFAWRMFGRVTQRETRGKTWMYSRTLLRMRDGGVGDFLPNRTVPLREWKLNLPVLLKDASSHRTLSMSRTERQASLHSHPLHHILYPYAQLLPLSVHNKPYLIKKFYYIYP